MRPVLCLFLLVGCEALDGKDDSGDTATSSATAATFTGEAGWVISAHPCDENRTDAWMWEDSRTAYAGCGQGAVGRGLYVSTDGGLTWGAPTTDPPGLLDTWRVLDVRRHGDGLLYVSGADTDSLDAVIALDTSGPAWTLAKTVFTRTDQIGFSFQVAHFLRDDSGRAFGESLTGADVIFRESDEDPWQSIGSGWADDGGGYQILSMDQRGTKFYGSGSTIADNPKVFLPGDAPDSLEVVTLSTDFTGELWGVDAVTDDRIIAGGVDQVANVGVVFSSGSNPSDVDDWVQYRVDTLIPGFSWIRGVCGQGSNVVAVGERQPLSSGTGIVLYSSDNGRSFADVTDGAITASSVSRCTFLADGRVAVAGAGGYVGLYFHGG
ncbi:MAG: hypothetical protein ACI9K2_001579 [Myxococcota bacterium]|jgi:hypothetical protein